MDDRFLTESRRDPEPGFARTLRARLSTIEAAGEAARSARWRPAVAAAAALAAVAALFTLPAVRATAQQVLDMFRVRDFAVIEVDERRAEQLKSRSFDPQTLLGGNVEKLQEP